MKIYHIDPHWDKPRNFGYKIEGSFVSLLHAKQMHERYFHKQTRRILMFV